MPNLDKLPPIHFSAEQEAAYLPMQDMIDDAGNVKHGKYEGRHESLVPSEYLAQVFTHKIADAMALKQILDSRDIRKAFAAMLAEDDDAKRDELLLELFQPYDK
jgi:hypothetical protein